MRKGQETIVYRLLQSDPVITSAKRVRNRCPQTTSERPSHRGCGKGEKPLPTDNFGAVIVNAQKARNRCLQNDFCLQSDPVIVMNLQAQKPYKTLRFLPAECAQGRSRPRTLIKRCVSSKIKVCGRKGQKTGGCRLLQSVPVIAGTERVRNRYLQITLEQPSIRECGKGKKPLSADYFRATQSSRVRKG